VHNFMGPVRRTRIITGARSAVQAADADGAHRKPTA
jgi:hypothetical protein